MKIINIKGKEVIVDDDDYLMLSSITGWIVDNYNVSKVYMQGKHVSMSNFIMMPPKGFIVDHINHNRLDNRKSNLRVCTYFENNRNMPKQMKKNGVSSLYKGVSFVPAYNKWRTTICKNYKLYCIYYGYSELEAAYAYNIAAIHLHKEFAYINKLNTSFPQVEASVIFILKNKYHVLGSIVI